MVAVSKIMNRFIVTQGKMPYVARDGMGIIIGVASRNMDAVQCLQDLGFKWNGDNVIWLTEDGTRWARIYPVRAIE